MASVIVEPSTAYDEIEFIPLKIAVNSETIYASFNGGSLNMIEYNLPQGSYLLRMFVARDIIFCAPEKSQ